MIKKINIETDTEIKLLNELNPHKDSNSDDNHARLLKKTIS